MRSSQVIISLSYQINDLYHMQVQQHSIIYLLNKPCKNHEICEMQIGIRLLLTTLVFKRQALHLNAPCEFL